jgi:hypothetical protein
MPAPRFTVPSSGNFTDSLTGARYQVIAGQSIDLDLAVRLGLSGAAEEVVTETPGVEIGDLTGVTTTNPNEGDLLVYRSGAWVNESPSYNFGVEFPDLIRWGKDNDTDWTTFDRICDQVTSRSGHCYLSLKQSAPRRTDSSVDDQVGSTVEGQAVVYGASADTNWTGLPTTEGDTITFSFWIRAATATEAGSRVWLVGFQDGTNITDPPLTLTESYKQISLTYPAGEFDVSAGAAVYIFFEGDEDHRYYLDDASYTSVAD